MTAKAQSSHDLPLLVALGVIPVLVVSMFVAFVLAGRYSLDDDKAVTLGLLGAVFVVLLDLYFLAFLVVARVREGRIAAAVKGGLLLLGAGLPIAAVVGALPWSTRWLLNSSPWVVFLLRALLAVWMIVALVQALKLPPGKSRYFSLNFLVLLAYTIIVNDGSVPHLLRLGLALTVIAGLIWRVLATWKRRRAEAPKASPA